MRGQTRHRQCIPLKTWSQRCKDRHATRILSDWPIARPNKASRGIHRIRDNNECFRLAAIQSLLHLPKFMNWILTHNENGNFPCHPDIMKRHSAHENWQGVCAACSFKKLIRRYWGNGKLCADGQPRPLAGNHVDIRRIHTLDDNISGMVGAVQQQDAEECQSRLLEACRDSVDYE